MTTDAMRDYLESHFHAAKKIIALEVEIVSLGTSPEHAKEVEALKAEIVMLKQKQTDVRALIRTLDDDDLESVLIMRYINHYTTEQTAETLNYARRTINNKIKRGIEKLCTQMP